METNNLNNENNTQQKKDSFDNLSKEELIKKCKHLLGIAQKAKQVKDDIQEENKSLANALKKLETKTRSETQTMQEIIDNLTQQKLQSVTDRDNLKKRISSLESKVKDLHNELHIERTKFETFETENEGLHRQVKRLTEENDQLISHLDVLEKQILELNKIGDKQREQLLVLEGKCSEFDNQKFDKNGNEAFKNLQEKYDTLLLQLEKYKSQRSDNKNENQSNLQYQESELASLNNENIQKISELQSKLETSEKQITVLKTKLENEKALKEKYNEKLKSHHSKLIKVFADIKELKQTKQNLMIIVQECSSHINRWQVEIANVTKRFISEVDVCNLEIKRIKDINSSLEVSNNDLVKECEYLKQKHNLDKVTSDNQCSNNLNTQIYELNSIIKTHEIKYKEVKEKNSILQKEITDYKVKLTNITSKESQNVNDDSNNLNQTKIELDQIKSDLDQTKKELEQITAVNLELESAKNDLNLKIDEYEQQCSGHLVKIQALEKLKNDFQTQLEKYKIKMAKNKQLLAQKTKLDQNEEVDQLQTNADGTTSQLTEVSSKNEDLEAAIKSYKTTIKDLQKKLKDSNELNESVTALHDHNISLKNSILESEQENSKLKTRIETVLKENEEKLKIVKEKLAMELSAVKIIEQTLKSENDGLWKEFAVFNNQHTEMKIKYEDLLQNFEAATLKIEELNSEISSSNKKLESEIAEKEKLLTCRNELEVQLDECKNKIQILESQINELSNIEKNETFTLQEENDKLKTEISILSKYKNTLEELQTQINESNANKNEINILQDEKQKLLDQISSLDNEFVILNQQVSELKIQLDSNQAEKSEIQTENQNLLREISELKIKNSSLDGEINSFNLQIVNLNDVLNSKNEVENQNQDLNNEILKLNQQIFDLNEKLKHFSELECQLEIKNLEQKELEEQNLKLNVEISSLNHKIFDYNDKTKVISELEKKLNSKDELEGQNSKLKDEILNLNKKISEFNDKIKLISELENRLKTKNNIESENVKLKENILSLNKKISSFDSEIEGFNHQISNLENQLMISKRENVELLKEMNDMNQVLKERGETISKQQEYVQELLKKLQNSEQEVALSKSQSEKLVEELKIVQQQNTENNQHDIEKEEKIKNLENEVQQLKDALQNTSRDINDDCRDSEAMSTSTVSRLDESARLKDLEDSWEERYTKLRTLALKLKCKVKELTEQLNQKRNQTDKPQSKNLQNMQAQLDKIQDENDILKSEKKDFQKQIENLTNEVENLKLINKSLQEDIESFRKGKEGGDSTLKQLNSQIQLLKTELDASNQKTKDYEVDISSLKIELQLKHEELLKESRSHNETKENLHKSNNEKSKKKSLLSLEMEKLEKTHKETIQKLEKKDEVIKDLERKLREDKDIVSSMKEQTHILEERIMCEESNSKEIELKLLESVKKTSELELIITQKEASLKEALKNLEDSKTSNDDLSTQLATTISQNQKHIEVLKVEKEQLKSQTIALEEKIKELTSSLKDRKEELKQISEEYNGYKIRAQSVLKQGKTRDLGIEERLSEEVSTLQTQLDTTKSDLEIITKKFNDITSLYEVDQIEIKKLLSRTKDLEASLKKEVEQNQNLQERHQKMINEHKEELRVQKIHTDTLVTCYKQQIADMEEKHAKELSEIKIQNQTPPNEVIDISFMKREDAEGSESIESLTNNTTSKNQPLALDKLLSMDPDLSSTTFEQELASCKQLLTQSEAKVAHLTELLADTEQDLAKHAQLNQMLKEEIRRQQRSVEREKHAENLEYLKNIVFKFVTLQSSDERTRLVPVLTTILKLSPEETNKLNSVAKGAEAAQRGWGSYLPMWPSGNGQQ